MERRKTARWRSFLGGRIAFNRRSSTLDCLVRNLSADGAKLSFPGTVTLPKEIDLAVDHAGVTKRARIVWRTETELGVAFCEAENAPAEVISLKAVRLLKEREKENAALKRRVEELGGGWAD